MAAKVKAPRSALEVGYQRATLAAQRKGVVAGHKVLLGSETHTLGQAGDARIRKAGAHAGGGWLLEASRCVQL